MQYKHIQISKLLKKITFNDVLFKGNYTLDPYQNCEFGCIYCDSSYEDTVFIKTNAIERFKEELSSFEKGRIIIGSVHDPYQPIEKSTQLTREILKIVKEQDIPIHILTKSTLITRDIDILKTVNDALVTLTIFTTDPALSHLFEPHVPEPQQRFETIQQLRQQGIKTGIALIPIMPHITEKTLEDLLRTAQAYHTSHIIYKHLELKGDQKQRMFRILEQIDPSLIPIYEELYHERYAPSAEYIQETNKTVEELCKRFHLPTYSI